MVNGARIVAAKIPGEKKRAQPPVGNLTSIWRCGCSVSRSAHCQTLGRIVWSMHAPDFWRISYLVWNPVGKAGPKANTWHFEDIRAQAWKTTVIWCCPAQGCCPPTWRRNRTTRWHHVSGTSSWEVGSIKGRWMPETACRKIPQHVHRFSTANELRERPVATMLTSMKPPDKNHSSLHEGIFVVMNTTVKFKTQLEKIWNMGILDILGICVRYIAFWSIFV